MKGQKYRVTRLKEVMKYKRKRSHIKKFRSVGKTLFYTLYLSVIFFIESIVFLR